MRTAEITRKTAETDICLSLSLDGTGKSDIDTGAGFMNHMLTLFASHGKFDLSIRCKGDTEVDYHHSVEDIGICLGEAVLKALSDKKGIRRYSHIILPMDEALVICAIDISGRSHLNFDVSIPTDKIGDFDSELIEEFLLAFVRSAGITLHVRMLAGTNSHHIVEAIFKAFARILSEAASIDQRFENEIPSTKGVL